LIVEPVIVSGEIFIPICSDLLFYFIFILDPLNLEIIQSLVFYLRCPELRFEFLSCEEQAFKHSVLSQYDAPDTILFFTQKKKKLVVDAI
jgi:hypothetical protein